MKMRICFAALILAFSLHVQHVNAQICTAKVLMTVGDDVVTTGDFLRVYKKNNKNAEMTETSLRDYMDLYVKFRLKVKEAKELHLDTASAFKKELNGYRDQLAQPYLTDSATIAALINEAYDRKQFDIRAKHILLKLPQNPSPKDTLEVYNKIMSIRAKALKGEDFGALAKQYSEDPSAADRVDPQSKRTITGNSGDLGYFTAFDMVYPFETAAYNAKIGEITMPVKTNFGYHIIKVVDRKPAMGMVQVAHIFILTPAELADSAKTINKKKIDEIYDMYKKGSAFDSLAKVFSDDKVTGANGGVIRWFGVSKMVPEFIETIYTLKNLNDVSAPIKTAYGWHLIKLIARKPIGSLSELQAELKTKVTKDRASITKEALVRNGKKEYGYFENKNNLKAFYTLIDTNIYTGNWNVDKAKNLSATLFTIGSKNVNQQDFAKYINVNQFIPKGSDFVTYVNNLYTKFQQETIIDYINTHLEDTHPDFKALMDEYRDGMLLFELTDSKVWSKAVKDTSGLKSYHEQNKNNYMWGDRVTASIYTCKNAETAKLVRKHIKKGLSNAKMLEVMNKEDKTTLTIDSAAYSKGENKLVDEQLVIPGISADMIQKEKVVLVRTHQKLAAGPKKLEECRGLVTSDYQTVLEKTWIEELRQKYPVKIDDACFAELFKK